MRENREETDFQRTSSARVFEEEKNFKTGQEKQKTPKRKDYKSQGGEKDLHSPHGLERTHLDPHHQKGTACVGQHGEDKTGR